MNDQGRTSTDHRAPRTSAPGVASHRPLTGEGVQRWQPLPDWATRLWIAFFGGGLVCLLAHMLR